MRILKPCTFIRHLFYTFGTQDYQSRKDLRIAWIWSHHLYLQLKFILLAGKLKWVNKAKLCWVNKLYKLFVFKSLLTTPTNVLPLHLNQTFLHIIWSFTKGEGDGIESRLHFKIFSSLLENLIRYLPLYFLLLESGFFFVRFLR